MKPHRVAALLGMALLYGCARWATRSGGEASQEVLDAAESGDVQRLLQMLERGGGAYARAANVVGWAPLHYAAGNGRARAVAVLLRAGAPSDAKDEDGWTALHYACANGHASVAAALLAAGGAASPVERLGATPMHWARPAQTVLRLGLCSADSLKRHEALAVHATAAVRARLIKSSLLATAGGTGSLELRSNTCHVPQKTAFFGNKDRQSRPHGGAYLLGGVSSTVPENRSVVS